MAAPNVLNRQVEYKISLLLNTFRLIFLFSFGLYLLMSLSRLLLSVLFTMKVIFSLTKICEYIRINDF